MAKEYYFMNWNESSGMRHALFTSFRHIKGVRFYTVSARRMLVVRVKDEMDSRPFSAIKAKTLKEFLEKVTKD